MNRAVRQVILGIAMAVCLYLTRDADISYVWTFGVFALGVAVSSAIYEFVAYTNGLVNDKVAERGHIAAD